MSICRSEASAPARPQRCGPGGHRPGRLRSRGLLALVAAGVVVIPLAGLVPAADAGEGDGSLTVRVVRDVNGNGTHEPRTELGVEGIGVQVTDGLGGLATGVTSPDGTVVIDLDPLSGGRYRVQTAIPPQLPYLQQTLVSLASVPDRLAPATSFVDVSDGAEVTHTVGIWDPADFVDVDARYITTQQPRNWNGLPSLDPALHTFPLGQRDSGGVTTEATWSQLGSTYGLAYDRTGRTVYIGALAKRHSGYGPGGGGAIYSFDVDSGEIDVFATVPDAAPTAHGGDIGVDAPFADVPGKESLGDVELAPDGQSVVAVALASKSLYRFPLDGGEPEVTPIPAPAGISDPDDWRPFALGVANGKLYVGGVQSAQTSGGPDALRVTVYQVDGTGFVPVLDGQLGGVQRGWVIGGPRRDTRTHWHPWTDNPGAGDGSQINGDRRLVVYPQPLLTDIEFDNAGSMLLGFRDRTSDQVGYRDTQYWTSNMSGGDLVKACGPVDGPWTIEYESDSPLCASNTAADPERDGGQDGGVREFYIGEFLRTSHQETALGGLRVNKSAGDAASTSMDPVGRINTGGVGWFDQLTGIGPGNEPVEERGLTLTAGANSYGKGNGLGDLELIVAQPPVQLGDRVWFDTDRDGAQDANEPPISGATVELVAEDGTVVATTTTDENGDYYFNESDGLEPDTSYQVRFDWSTGTIFGEPVPQGSAYTTPLAAGDSPEGPTTVDSNVIPTEQPTIGLTPVESLVPGEVNHDYDAGINPPVPGYELVKTADPGQGAAVAPGSPIRYTITGTNTGQTVLDPVRITDDLSDVLDDADLSGPITLRVLDADGDVVSDRTVPLNVDRDEDGTPDGFAVDDVVLQIGERVVVSYEVRVRPSGAGDGAIDNGATSSAQPPSPVPPGPCCQVPPPEPITTETARTSQTVLVEEPAPPAKPAEPAPPPPSKNSAPAEQPEKGLAVTGVQIAGPLAVAALLVAAGAVAVAATRRRSTR
jgi:uncharacterized repeat protein (TIGR01451 family)